MKQADNMIGLWKAEDIKNSKKYCIAANKSTYEISIVTQNGNQEIKTTQLENLKIAGNCQFKTSRCLDGLIAVQFRAQDIHTTANYIITAVFTKDCSEPKLFKTDAESNNWYKITYNTGLSFVFVTGIIYNRKKILAVINSDGKLKHFVYRGINYEPNYVSVGINNSANLTFDAMSNGIKVGRRTYEINTSDLKVINKYIGVFISESSYH